jgi:hypothetical protein
MFQGPSCKRDVLNVPKGALKDVYRMLNTSYIFLQEKVPNDHPVCEERERKQEGILLRKTKKGSSTEREREREPGSVPYGKQILQT